MAEIADLTSQTRADGGYFLVFQQSGGTVVMKRLSMSEINALLDKADAALTEDDVGDMALESKDDYMLVADFTTTVAGLNLVIAEQNERITQLEGLIGIGSIVVYEEGVYEPGVYVG